MSGPGAAATITVIGFTCRDGAFHMAMDEHLFCLCEEGAGAFLRLYTWAPPALSLGFHEPGSVVDADAAREAGIDVVRRPTGGRVVLHKNDLTYTVVLPAARVPGSVPGAAGTAAGAASLYALVSRCLVEGLGALSSELSIERGRQRGGLEGARPCFASTSRHEITWRGRKLVGSAQRVGRRSLLQHGSIPVGRDYLDVARYLAGTDSARLRRDLAATTACLEDLGGGPVDTGGVVHDLEAAFCRGLELRAVHEDPSRYEPDACPERVRPRGADTP